MAKTTPCDGCPPGARQPALPERRAIVELDQAQAELDEYQSVSGWGTDRCPTRRTVSGYFGSGMTIRFAVTVEPSLAPATPISVPTFTALAWIVVRCSMTRSGLPNTQVWVKPSVDLTVTEVSSMAVTVPR